MSSTDLALRDDASRELRRHGDQYVAPLAQTARFGDAITRHHRPFYDDYTVAKMHIMQAVGDLTGFEVFGRQILLAVFCRPNVQEIKRPDGTVGALYLPVKEIKEDWWQNKAMLVLAMGPGAFAGDQSYLDMMFRSGVAPKPGEWLFANASAGIQVNMAGEGASRPQAVDRRGEPMDLFEWDGWPCRIVTDESIIGRLDRPHELV